LVTDTHNNRHASLLVVINLPDWMSLHGFPWFFTAAQMHLHWGSGGPGHGGSEHTINGQSADAEVPHARGFLLKSPAV